MTQTDDSSQVPVAATQAEQIDPDMVWRVTVFKKGSDKPVLIEFGPDAPENSFSDAAMHAVARALIQLGTSMLSRTMDDDD